jgi:hypothetical protein
LSAGFEDVSVVVLLVVDAGVDEDVSPSLVDFVPASVPDLRA